MNVWNRYITKGVLVHPVSYQYRFYTACLVTHICTEKNSVRHSLTT